MHERFTDIRFEINNFIKVYIIRKLFKIPVWLSNEKITDIRLTLVLINIQQILLLGKDSDHVKYVNMKYLTIIICMLLL